jgi:DNA-binding SARP family transcriptional activator/predicted ATPase
MSPVKAMAVSNGDLPVRICLFGQPRVFSTDGSREFLLPRKTLNVLAYLILNRRRPSARDSVAFALFPDDEEDVARGHLRRNLSYLLSSLPASSDEARFVFADTERISWNAGAPARVDVIVFDRAIADGRDDDAIAEYDGDLLPTLYDEWTTAERERLRDAFHEALARTVARDRSLRHFDLATAAAHRLLEGDPWREDVLRQLMAIRYEAGDRAGALAAFERFAVRLRDEMRAEPMPETLAVREAVLRGARLATSEPADARSAADVSPAPGLPFVGRSAPMETALARWHAAADGRANVLFISGEAGVGKSRFSAELARAIEREGGFTLRGETAPGGEHRPYEAFVEALRSVSLTRARRVTNRELDVWPDVLEELLAEHASATFVDDRAARVRLFDSVRRGLTDLARTRPVAVILEDLHWAGSATVDLLEFIGTRLAHAPVLIVATFRSDEAGRAHPLHALHRHLESRATATTLALDRLSIDDATAAVRAAAPSIDDAALARMVAWAGGSPLLLTEALRDLSAGRIEESAGITELVGARLARLSPAAQTVLTYGAVVGARFDLAALAAATGWADDELVEGLGESIELGLIRATTHAPGLAFAFTHHLVHAAALERLSANDLKRAHALVARALVSMPRVGGTRAAEVARHFEAAGERIRAAEYLLRAAGYALDVFASQDARDAATAGLVLTDVSDPNQRLLRYDLVAARERALARIGALDERRADALALRDLAGTDPDLEGDALERLFDSHRDVAAIRREVLKRLGVLATHSERRAAVFERASAMHAFTEGDYPTARDAALRAAERFERTGDSRAALLARLQYIGVLGRLGTFDEAATAISNLRPVFDASNDFVLRAEFHRVASSAANDERRDLALADARRSLELSLHVGDRYAEARARQNVATILGKLGDHEQALAEHNQALEAYRDVGDATGIADSIVNLANGRAFCGDPVSALQLLDELASDTSARPWVALRLAATRGAIAMQAGDSQEADRQFRHALALATRLGSELYLARSHAFLGLLRARTGQPGAARVHLDEAIARFAPLGQPGLLAGSYAVSARLHAAMGNVDSAHLDAKSAAELAERFPIQHYAEPAWHLAAAYALTGKTAEALQFAEVAVKAFVNEALRMNADLAEAYARLPCHQHAVAFVFGRSVPLRLDEAATNGAF